jgi:hypothetical protein
VAETLQAASGGPVLGDPRLVGEPGIGTSAEGYQGEEGGREGLVKNEPGACGLSDIHSSCSGALAS